MSICAAAAQRKMRETAERDEFVARQDFLETLLRSSSVSKHQVEGAILELRLVAERVLH
jgi:hypothetical protein